MKKQGWGKNVGYNNTNLDIVYGSIISYTHREISHFQEISDFLHIFYCPPKRIVPFLSETSLKLVERVSQIAVFEMLNYP